ncbi:hypothetical protein JR316_0006030 [Psilocybe cubensis]|uniref:Uncharacterized protein n=2 Tax=Psilocybe cubensis TaxID=181762 RepID=A0ACB8H0H2_PSICU|nr:hypothetical protein JR316_0006030 [Psilocybe cubensis]KAH9481503.1 hypothetical protein JR316_0006030 [Psilocybe cubensis]
MADEFTFPSDPEAPSIEIEYVHTSTSVAPQESNILLDSLYPPRRQYAASDSGSEFSPSCPPSPASVHSFFSDNLLSADFFDNPSRSADSLGLIDSFDNLDVHPENSPDIPSLTINSDYTSTNAPPSPISDQNLSPSYIPSGQLLPFYQINASSSLSLPEYLYYDQYDQRRPLIRVASSTSLASSSNDGHHTPYTPDIHGYFDFSPALPDAPWQDDAQSYVQPSESPNPSSPTIDMNQIHETIKEHAEQPTLVAVHPSAPGVTTEINNSNAPTIDVQRVRQLVEASSAPHVRAYFKKNAKQAVSTHAGLIASNNRRKFSAKFPCSICGHNFTRKLGLNNHLKAHLGIVDQHCRFCTGMFATSLKRHMKRCRFNPDRETANRGTSSLPSSSSSSSSLAKGKGKEKASAGELAGEDREQIGTATEMSPFVFRGASGPTQRPRVRVPRVKVNSTSATENGGCGVEGDANTADEGVELPSASRAAPSSSSSSKLLKKHGKRGV